jgi:hypothetical protein
MAFAIILGSSSPSRVETIIDASANRSGRPEAQSWLDEQGTAAMQWRRMAAVVLAFLSSGARSAAFHSNLMVRS